LSYALCGVSNKRTLEVVRHLLKVSPKRPEPPLFVASTLLVPGYVDEAEVTGIAGLIAEFDPRTPYSLLAFAPSFRMSDMPATSVGHAGRCLDAARGAGLERVRIGNRHLLGKDY
jgi:pyruvate formate lyase activating enzyme